MKRSLSAAGRLELAKDVADVGFDRLLPQAQLSRDLLVGAAQG
jgi:hypothetical protein